MIIITEYVGLFILSDSWSFYFLMITVASGIRTLNTLDFNGSLKLSNFKLNWSQEQGKPRPLTNGVCLKESDVFQSTRLQLYVDISGIRIGWPCRPRQSRAAVFSPVPVLPAGPDEIHFRRRVMCHRMEGETPSLKTSAVLQWR
jgi:hypothetical protein